MTFRTGTANCMKNILFAYNFLFCITGILLITDGIIVNMKFQDYEIFLGQKFFSTPTLLIVVGLLIFSISIFGCFSTIKEHYWMTIAFAILMISIFVLEFVVCLSGYTLQSDTPHELRNNMHKSMQKYGKPNHQDVKIMWDAVQHSFKCCGIDGYKDWQKVNQDIPISCCSKLPINITSNRPICGVGREYRTLYLDGCMNILSDCIGARAGSIGNIGITLLVFQLTGIVLSCYLIREIRGKEFGYKF